MIFFMYYSCNYSPIQQVHKLLLLDTDDFTYANKTYIHIRTVYVYMYVCMSV